MIKPIYSLNEGELKFYLQILMANSLELRDFMVPVKHPQQIFYGLLCEHREDPLISNYKPSKNESGKGN